MVIPWNPTSIYYIPLIVGDSFHKQRSFNIIILTGTNNTVATTTTPTPRHATPPLCQSKLPSESTGSLAQLAPMLCLGCLGIPRNNRGGCITTELKQW